MIGQADGRAEVRGDDPEYGVSSGQACVGYDDERVLGGGWISGATPVYALEAAL
ncbi:MAG: aminomethyltransferase beta-barrel domain-containing protein [Sphingomonadales bacterium]